MIRYSGSNERYDASLFQTSATLRTEEQKFGILTIHYGTGFRLRKVEFQMHDNNKFLHFLFVKVGGISGCRLNVRNVFGFVYLLI